MKFTVYEQHMWKEFSDSNKHLKRTNTFKCLFESEKQLLAKYRVFNKLPQISHIDKNCFQTIGFKFKYNWNFLDKQLLPYNFHSSSMRKCSFSILPGVSDLNTSLKTRHTSKSHFCKPCEGKCKMVCVLSIVREQTKISMKSFKRN